MKRNFLMQPAPAHSIIDNAANRSHGEISGKRALVVGLGRFGGGVGVTRWLVEQGAQVTVTDRADAASLADSIEAIDGLSVALRLGTHDGLKLSDFDLAIINPAVHKATSELFAEIVRCRIPWTTEMNLFCERCPASVIGVTGSFGKSTTCAMLAEALERGRKDCSGTYTGVHLGGNIGRSLLGALSTIRSTDVVVLEMSNAQLEDLPRIDWSPTLAAITNLHPQHLDRHGTFEAYVKAKLNLVRAGRGEHPVVMGEVKAEARAWVEEAAGGARRLIHATAPSPPIELRVAGRHNAANAACAWSIARELGISDDSIRSALREFRGLPHRLELVRTVGGVSYVNDSKSTAPAATIIALEAVGESMSGSASLMVLVGGQRKDVALADCSKAIARRCRVAICFGEAGPVFAEAIRGAAGFAPRSNVEVREAAGVAEAVEIARREARSGDIVLLSPGAPSFDQYVNFMERGRHFVELVRRL